MKKIIIAALAVAVTFGATNAFSQDKGTKPAATKTMKHHAKKHARHHHKKAAASSSTTK